MNIEDRTEFWDLIGKIAGDLDDTDHLIIRYVGQGEPQTKIAELIGIHRKSVRYRLDRIRRLIKRKNSFVHFPANT